MRKQGFKVFFGTIENIEKKFQNYKAFCKKATRDNILGDYKLVNLQFGNQVVATKK